MYRIFQGLRVIQYISDTGSKTITLNDTANSICVLNDSGADMTVTVNGVTCTIKGTDNPFDECFEPFKSITVSSTGAYRIIVRG